MDQPKILVAIRKRPLSKKEQSKGDTDIISVKNNQTVIVSEYKQKVDLTKYLEETLFNFDFVYNEDTTNEQIYESAVRPLVESAFQGAKVTCFAYGQTGSGKTFTMNGNPKMGVTGLYTYGAKDIFTYLSDPNFQHLKARLSFFEIYCGKLFDLLNKRQELKILEDKKNNINIIGLQQTHITSWEQFLQLLEYGSTQRITSQNSANAQSSRSHAILQISLKEGKKIFGKISFIDLAGNQRGADHTDMKKQTRIDGAQINKSLLSLKQCIRALDQGKGHTPFRGSKLTMVLKDSFIGFCRTVMIGNVSPSSSSSENTLNTLRYADRVKQLRKPTQTLSKQEIRARQMMLPRQNKNAIKISIEHEDDAEDIEAKRQKARVNFGVKDQIKQTEKKVNEMSSMKQEQTRNKRQQSFGGGKNELKQSQHLDTKKQKIQVPHQISAKSIKQQPPLSNMGKMIPKSSQPNEKKELNLQRRGSSNLGERPRPLFHTKNKESEMDIEEDSSYNPSIASQGQFNNQFNNFMNPPSNNYNSVKTEQYKGGYQFQPNQQQFQPNHQQFQPNQQQFQPNYAQQYQPNSQQFHQKNIYQNQPQMNIKNPQNFHPLQSNTHLFNTNQPQNYDKGLKQPQYKNPYLPPPIVIPNDWNDMEEFYRNTQDNQIQETVRRKMHEHLFEQENELMNNHSDSLRSSLDIIKSQMNILGALENDKETMSTREYIRFMEESIDQKISVLELLRQKMAQFSYKLDTIEQMQEKEVRRGDDEQLLDDLH